MFEQFILVGPGHISNPSSFSQVVTGVGGVQECVGAEAWTAAVLAAPGASVAAVGESVGADSGEAVAWTGGAFEGLLWTRWEAEGSGEEWDPPARWLTWSKYCGVSIANQFCYLPGFCGADFLSPVMSCNWRRMFTLDRAEHRQERRDRPY